MLSNRTMSRALRRIRDPKCVGSRFSARNQFDTFLIIHNTLEAKKIPAINRIWTPSKFALW